MEGHRGLFWKCEASLKGPIQRVPGRAARRGAQQSLLQAVLAQSPAQGFIAGPSNDPQGWQEMQAVQKGAHQGALLGNKAANFL